MTMTLAIISSGATLLLTVRSLVAASGRVDRMLADLGPPPSAAGETPAAER